MKNYLLKTLLLFPAICFISLAAEAQKKRTATKRPSTATKKTTKGKAKTTVGQVQIDSTATATADPKAPEPAETKIDSLPIKKVRKSIPNDGAVDIRGRFSERDPLPYEHIRPDDAVYRQRIWRDIDTREKMNLPFRHSADEDNGNQRFISILFKAIQEDSLSVYDPIDDRFTTPMSISSILKWIGGDAYQVEVFDSAGVSSYKTVTPDIVLDSFYKFRIKEEVVFDKESSRLWWRILGIAPLFPKYSPQTKQLIANDQVAFWVYYPELRKHLGNYRVYNGKNYGLSQTWEELFENRMFSGRIVKSSVDNPFDKYLDEMPGLKGNGVFQLLEGERIKEKVLNYELDLWSY
jgi:gliding motility associated protien GldN